MKKLSLLIAVILITCTSSFAQMTKDQVVAEWTRAKAYTKAYLDAMPADGFTSKATPEVRTYAQQFLHLADANYFFIATATGKTPSLAKGVSVEKTVEQTKEATTKAVMDSYDFAIASIASMADTQMQDMVDMGKMKATRGQLLAKAFEHQTHHRGQGTIYLRLKGVTPPPEMLF